MPQSPFHVLLKGLSRQKKAAYLLDMLPEGGPTAFDAFVVALECTGQSNLAGELRTQEADARVKERQVARVEERKAKRVLFPIVQHKFGKSYQTAGPIDTKFGTHVHIHLEWIYAKQIAPRDKSGH